VAVLNSTVNWLLQTILSGGTREKLKDRIIDADRIFILTCYWTPAVNEGMVGDRLGAAPHNTVATLEKALPNSPWAGIINLFPARKSLVSDIPAGDGETANLFLQCIHLQILSPLCFQSDIAARQDKILFSSIFKSFYSSQD
jgi:hypothetical protein